MTSSLTSPFSLKNLSLTIVTRIIIATPLTSAEVRNRIGIMLERHSTWALAKLRMNPV